MLAKAAEDSAAPAVMLPAMISVELDAAGSPFDDCLQLDTTALYEGAGQAGQHQRVAHRHIGSGEAPGAQITRCGRRQRGIDAGWRAQTAKGTRLRMPGYVILCGVLGEARGNDQFPRARDRTTTRNATPPIRAAASARARAVFRLPSGLTN